ncbi:MAG TPA: LapA family protein [Gaiella sp.]|nr:LapA family protein [Gaiella sp.]
MADERQAEPSGGVGGIPRWKLVLWGAVAIYAVAFLLLNSSKQEVSFVFFSVNTRLIWLILLSMALGAVLGRIGPRWWRSRGRD